MNTKKLYLGGGCFWCLDAVFRQIPGVVDVVSGYAGGDAPDPTYQEVCSGLTGHAEVVEIEYDSSTVNEKELLNVFWKCHDPTTPNQQGADVGTQYRSILLYNSEKEKNGMKASLQQHAPDFPKPIVTEIVPLETFYPAEGDHQNFYHRNPQVPYCQFVIYPKLTKLFSKIER